MRKLLFAALVMTTGYATCADWDREMVSPGVEALYDSETATLVVKGEGEVRSFPEGCFPFIRTARNLVVAEGITAIGSYAFACRGGLLTNVVMEAGIEHIESGAFAYQANLRRIYMPEGLLTLGSYAFQDCSSLSAVTIPESAQIIDTMAFQRSAVLTLTFLGQGKPIQMEVDSSALRYLIQPGASPFSFVGGPGDSVAYVAELNTWVKDGGVVIEPNTVTPYSGDLVLPEEWEVSGKVYPVRGIADNAFKDCLNLTSIRIPAGVTSIGAKAFSGCSGLKSIRFLGDRPSSVGADSFAGVNAAVYRTRSGKGWASLSKTWAGASALYYHEFGPAEWVMSVEDEDGDRYARLMPNASREMSGDIKIPSAWVVDGVTYPVREIGESAFANCTGISSVQVPDTVRKIADGAFYGCTGLARLRFAGNRPSVENDYVFYDVTATVYYPPSKEGWSANAENWGGATQLTYKPYEGVPSDLTELTMAIGDIQESGTIVLSQTGSFADETFDLEMPEGKSITVDLQGQTLKLRSLALNGSLTLVDASDAKTGFLSCGEIQAGENGHLSFEASRRIRTEAEFDEICGLNRLGAAVLAVLDSDLEAMGCTVPENTQLILDLNSHVFRSALNVDGSLVVRDTSADKSGFIAGQIEKREGASVSFELDGNIAGVASVYELNCVAEMNAMGADVQVRLLSDIDDEIAAHVIIPEEAILTIYTDDHWILGCVELFGSLHMADTGVNESYGGIYGAISCADGSHIDGHFVRYVSTWNYSHLIGSYEGEGSFRESLALIKAGATVTTCLDTDIRDTFEIPEGKSLTIDLCGHRLSGEITVNGTLYVTDPKMEGCEGALASDLVIGGKGKVTGDVSRSIATAEDLSRALSLTHGEGLPLELTASLTCDVVEVPEGAVQTIDLAGRSLTCKTLKILGALTLVDSQGSDGFIEATRTLLGRKGSMKVDYGPIRTTCTYMNPGFVLLFK